MRQYELLARLFESGADPRPAFSIDTNNHHLFGGAYFIDFVGGNHGWPDADWPERERIFQDHANYQIGVMHFLTHSERVPEKWRTHFRQYGLPADEYEDTGGWTHQLYIREGRRMVTDYVMTQHTCQGREVPEGSIGLASYNMDSHHCQMGVAGGFVRNEGNVEIGVRPYRIAYRAITPQRGECTNLLVPVALSSSHIAFGSIRMEPVFMILGQSAATAAAIAIEDEVAVQDVSYPKLEKRLRQDKQILDAPIAAGAKKAADLEGVVVDDERAKLEGDWTAATHSTPFIDTGYRHDANMQKGESRATFTATLPQPGRYEVRLAYTAHSNRATNVPVTVTHADGTASVTVDQQKAPPEGGLFVSLGEYDFGRTARVTVSNAGTNGHVIVDGVQWLSVKGKR